MLNFDRGNRAPNPKDPPAKPGGLKPALYDPPIAAATPTPTPAPRPGAFNPAPGQGVPPAPARDVTISNPASSTAPGAATRASDPHESRLHVGVNIKLKGVEISDCDALVIEGYVEATVNSKAMEIGQPGTLKGTALIDVAEIHGEFTGELTARSRLIVHGTGRVSGTIRYGKLVVEEGGELSGDLQRISDRDTSAKPPVGAGSLAEARTGFTNSAK